MRYLIVCVSLLVFIACVTPVVMAQDKSDEFVRTMGGWFIGIGLVPR